MFSSNFTRYFTPLTLIFLFFSGCSLWQKPGTADSPATPAVADELKSEIPFAGKEPERFQAEIVVTANETERRTFIARSGANRRFDFNVGAPNQLTSLQTDKNYLVLPARKIYAENAAPAAPAADRDEWADFLTTEWLSSKTDARFEKLETAGDLTKYRVRLGDAGAAEVFLYVDEKLGLPVRQEFYSGGDPKTLTYRFELQNLKLEPDGVLFTVPADYKKVSAEEFGKILSGEE